MSGAVQSTSALLLPTGGCRGGRHVSGQQAQLQVEGARQGVEGQSGGAVVGVHRHAGVLDQQVLQRTRLQEDGLAAAAGEAGRGGDEPALLQRADVQAKEPALFFVLGVVVVLLLLLRPAVWVGVSRGVEGGAGGVADWRAGHGGRDHHQVFLLVFLGADVGSRETVSTLRGAGFSCRERRERRSFTK